MRLGEEGGDTLVGLSSRDLPWRWEDMTYNGLENWPLVRISKAVRCAFQLVASISPISWFSQIFRNYFPVQSECWENYRTAFQLSNDHF